MEIESGIYKKEDATYILFGGKIGVVGCSNNSNTEVSISFHTLKDNHKVGEDKPEPLEEHVDDYKVHLIFNSIESIEVIERALNNLKEILKEK